MRFIMTHRSESLILSCLHTFLTCLFDVLRFFMIKLSSLLVQCNACQVDIGFRKVFFSPTSMYRCLGGGAPVIYIPRSWDSAPSQCLSRSDN